MPSAAKSKGNGWERQLCEHLTKIFGLNFMRVPTSGAFVGRSNAFRLNTLTPAQQLLATGDIIMPEQLSKFSIECKFYKDFPFHTLLTEDGNKQLDDWIAQTTVASKQWFVIFKLNNKGAFVVFPKAALIQYVIPGNYISYREYKVVKLENFFESNKEKILEFNQIPI